ncbi:unnamed protein product [Linum tenue]|uniref:Trehalose 6-phosphate phosphatase n=1 Tax=Linum tenue TaxID=586396 RepID=A0AAV0JSG2_9ROSI|nr:unnamed protein product [Linum tenue]
MSISGMLKRNISRINQAMGLPQRSSSNNKPPKPGQHGNNNSSSDPHPVNTKTAPISDHVRVKSTEDVQYKSWVGEHPSALHSFDQMMKVAKGKKIVVFLDYDGTLSPIVDDPNSAFMSEEMRAAVREVAKCFPTAIISGRSRDKVKEFVQLSNVYYAGSHGMDIMAPPRPVKSCDGNTPTVVMDKKGTEVLFQPAKSFLPAIQKILTELEEETAKIKGAMVEDNRFCVSVHFRHVKDEVKHHHLLVKKLSVQKQNSSLINSKVWLLDFRIIRSWRRKSGLCWRIMQGFTCAGVKRCFYTFYAQVMEIRPMIEWDKGHAVEYFLETLGLSNSDVLPVYIGDDRTDEDAFKVIQRRGQGYPIIVTSIPKDTKASYSLIDPSEVLTFLLRLARWRKSSSSSRSLNQIWGVVN